MWFAPEISATFSEMLEDMFRRSGPFEAVPYSGFEVLLASEAKRVGQEPNALRRLCFECITGINKPIDREESVRKKNLYFQCVATYNRARNIVIGLDDAYRLTRKDFGAVRRELIDAGSLPPSAELLGLDGSLVLHWKTDFPRHAVAFEMTGRAGRDTALSLIMTVLGKAGNVLASVPIRGAFLDFDGYLPSFDALRGRCATDASYASAILAHLAGAWGTGTGQTVRQS